MDALATTSTREDLLAYSGAYDSLADYTSVDSTRRPARICIMTQDIFGPIRNAGIGTAFMYAAEFLAAAGHDVTILFTQGRISHSRSIDHWIDFYKEKQIKFLCAEGLKIRGPSPALEWSYQGYRSLLKLPEFDIVHSSECGASPYYSLMAKRNLGQFKNTVFCTKTSSPHLWNRQGNEGTINLDTGLIICAAERYCVEKADLVIAPTQHMLDWMVQNQYTLPKHVCVQPNPVPVPADFKANSYDQKPQKIDELVFFGRLEARKGILLFAEALELLHCGGTKKLRVVFLGKKTDNFDFDDFFSVLKSKLPFDFRGIHNFDATQAIAYLRGSGRLAVAPSLVDQAALTAYESIVNGIPFIAAATGGIPEIIHRDDRDRVLFLPRPQALHRLLERCLKAGASTARLSFDPIHNFATWDNFHRSPNHELLGGACGLPTPKPEAYKVVTIGFDGDATDPLRVEELQSATERATTEYIILCSDKLKLSDAEKSNLAAITTSAAFDVAVPTVNIQSNTPEVMINFEPSRWTKLEFSKIEIPALLVKRIVLSELLEYFKLQIGGYYTNLDTIVAVACAQDRSVRIIPTGFGTFSGPVVRRLTRRQRARQVEHLVVGLPPDLGNLFRLYGGLVDERARVLSVQAVLKNLQRLLRVLGKLEDVSTTSAVEGPSRAGKTRKRPKIWRGWDRQGPPLGMTVRFKSIGTWLKTLTLRGTENVRSANSDD